MNKTLFTSYLQENNLEQNSQRAFDNVPRSFPATQLDNAHYNLDSNVNVNENPRYQSSQLLAHISQPNILPPLSSVLQSVSQTHVQPNFMS